MRPGRKRTAQNRRRGGNRGARITEHCRYERRAGRDADEGVRSVPDAVQPWQLVGEELDERHEAARREHERVLEDVEVAGELQVAEIARQPDDEDDRISAQPGAPSEGGGERELGQAHLTWWRRSSTARTRRRRSRTLRSSTSCRTRSPGSAARSARRP